MADDTDIDELVLAGHGGALHHADDGVDPNEARREALERRLKCEVIRVAEEAARRRESRSPLTSRRCLHPSTPNPKLYTPTRHPESRTQHPASCVLHP